MRSCVLRALKKRLDLVCALVLLALCLGLAGGPAMADRGVPIDNNTDEIWSDADNAQTMALPFPVNYGAGLQSSVTVQLPSSFTVQPSGPALAAVGLTFTSSPSEVLFAKVIGGSDPFQQRPAVRLGNATETSTPLHPVSEASTFDFGVAYNLNGPAPADTSDCDISGITMACYGPMTDSAIFQFIDKSGSGNPGDFELILQCINECTNIGFNLGGLNFSADDFIPVHESGRCPGAGQLGTYADWSWPDWRYLEAAAQARVPAGLKHRKGGLNGALFSLHQLQSSGQAMGGVASPRARALPAAKGSGRPRQSAWAP